MTRAALLTSVSLATLALTAGCTEDGGGSGGTPAAAPAGAVSGGPTSDPGDGAGSIGDPGDGDMLAGQGDQADWETMVQACPNSGQKIVVQQVVTADVTGDKIYDALVARSCEAATSYWPSTVEIFDGASSSARPRRVGTLLTDVGPTDRPWLTKLRVDGGVVVIEANGVDGHSGDSCPDLHFTYRYRFGDGAFQRDGREVGNAGTCLPAG